MNSREKGKRGEREWASVCREHGYKGARRGQQYCGANGDADVVDAMPHIHVEVKRVERLNMYNAMAQVIHDSGKSGRMPIVAHRKNNSKWLITMRAEDWFSIYREFEASMALKEQESNGSETV